MESGEEEKKKSLNFGLMDDSRGVRGKRNKD